MAKPPAKTSAKPADSPLRKAAKKVATAPKPDTAAVPAKAARAKKADVATPAAAAAPVAAPVPVKPSKTKAAAPTPAAATKPAKSPKPPKGKAARKSVLQEIAQLASDILEDRIVPTIDQIKALAASALGRETKAKKPKRKKK